MTCAQFSCATLPSPEAVADPTLQSTIATRHGMCVVAMLCIWV